MISLVRVLFKILINMHGFYKVQVNVFIYGQFNVLHSEMPIQSNIYFALKKNIGCISRRKTQFNNLCVVDNNGIGDEKLIKSRSRITYRTQKFIGHQENIVFVNIHL